MKTLDAAVIKKDKFNESYLSVYRFHLEKKRDQKILKFAKNHSENEVQCKKMALDLDIKNKLNKKESKLSHKTSKWKISKENKIEQNQKRIWIVDLARGLVIIGMLVDHFIGDFWMVVPEIFKDFYTVPFFKNMYDFSNAYWSSPIRITFRLIGLMVLLLVAGISTKFSKNNLKRSLLIIGFGLLIDVGFAFYATFLGGPGDYIIIGAVLCIGICVAIYSFLRWLFYKFAKNAWGWVSLGFGIGILATWGIVSYYNATDKSNFWFYFNNCYTAIPGLYNIKDVTGANFWRVIFGLTYYGSDWLGLFPYLGYIFIGGFIGEVVYRENKPLLKCNYQINTCLAPVNFFGKETLWFYILHQPIFIAIIAVVGLCLGCKLGF